MSDAELQRLFPDGRARVTGRYDLPDFARVVTSMKSNPHFTLLQAWRTSTAAVSSDADASASCEIPRSANSSLLRSRAL